MKIFLSLNYRSIRVAPIKKIPRALTLKIYCGFQSPRSSPCHALETSLRNEQRLLSEKILRRIYSIKLNV